MIFRCGPAVGTSTAVFHTLDFLSRHTFTGLSCFAPANALHLLNVRYSNMARSKCPRTRVTEARCDDHGTTVPLHNTTSPAHNLPPPPPCQPVEKMAPSPPPTNPATPKKGEGGLAFLTRYLPSAHLFTFLACCCRFLTYLRYLHLPFASAIQSHSAFYGSNASP